MAKKDAAEFLRNMNAMNDAMVARAAEAKIQSQAGQDPIRVQRDAERREQPGQLRARLRRRRKTGQVANVFGNIYLGE